MLKDTQSERDSRGIAIGQVGIRGLRYPIVVEGRPSVGIFSLGASLAAAERGTHMSRFVESVHAHQNGITPEVLQSMGRQLCRKLKADSAVIRVNFPFFVEKQAPVSGMVGSVDYDVVWEVIATPKSVQFAQEIQVPIGTLCPCSKAISERGAHNQRGHVNVRLETAKPLALGKLIALIEEAASSELYSVLKRPDEKAVTERAYDNPAFVEDVVREVVLRLKKLKGLRSFSVDVENFESIHNHNAYAIVQG
jgi:GTP cyclohydrolase I